MIAKSKDQPSAAFSLEQFLLKGYSVVHSCSFYPCSIFQPCQSLFPTFAFMSPNIKILSKPKVLRLVNSLRIPSSHFCLSLLYHLVAHTHTHTYFTIPIFPAFNTVLKPRHPCPSTPTHTCERGPLSPSSPIHTPHPYKSLSHPTTHPFLEFFSLAQSFHFHSHI